MTDLIGLIGWFFSVAEAVTTISLAYKNWKRERAWKKLRDIGEKVKVEKPGNKTESFSVERIRRSIINAGIPVDVAENVVREIVNEIYNKRKVKSKYLESLIIEYLDKIDPTGSYSKMFCDYWIKDVYLIYPNGEIAMLKYSEVRSIVTDTIASLNIKISKNYIKEISNEIVSFIKMLRCQRVDKELVGILAKTLIENRLDVTLEDNEIIKEYEEYLKAAQERLEVGETGLAVKNLVWAGERICTYFLRKIEVYASENPMSVFKKFHKNFPKLREYVKSTNIPVKYIAKLNTIVNDLEEYFQRLREKSKEFNRDSIALTLNELKETVDNILAIELIK